MKKKGFFDKTQNNNLFISPTAENYSERFQDMYIFSELIWSIRKVGKIDSGKMQGQSAFLKELAVLIYTVCKRPITRMPLMLLFQIVEEQFVVK